VEPGDVLDGRFALEAVIATGGMGRVFRALDRRDGTRVAVKTLRAPNEEHELRFIRESAVLAKLAHPTIVGYRGHGRTGGELYLAMEWLDGEDLATRIARGPLPVADAIAIAVAAAQALALSHAHGVIHRDIKPSNLFLARPTGELKVLDFGIAHLAPVLQTFEPHESLTRAGTVIGTVGYIAPEVARGNPPEARSDLFSLGAVLFEALTGTKAFTGSSAFAVLAKVVSEPAVPVSELRPEVPRALEALVARLLAKTPEERPASAIELATALRNTAPAAREPAAHRGAAVGARERRLTGIVIARSAAVAADVTAAIPDAARATEALEPLRARFDAKIVVLGEGSVIAMLDLAGDLRARVRNAARLAIALSRELDGHSIVLATGRATSTGPVPVGRVIDEASSALERTRPGTIRVDEHTARLLGDEFVVRKDEHGHVLAGKLGSTSPALLGRLSRFAGRTSELEALIAAFDQTAYAREPGIALVSGAAGAGKSRLCSELLGSLVSRGVRSIARCAAEPTEGAPYAAIRDLVRSAFAIGCETPNEEARLRIRQSVDRLVPDDADAVAPALGLLAGVDSLAGEESALIGREVLGDRLRGAFVRWLGAAAMREPVVLYLEDVPWADAASIRLLGHAVGALRAAPVFILASARSENAGDLAELFLEPHVLRIELEPLSLEACGSIVRDALGGDTSDALIASLAQRSGGNAFFLEELVRSAGGRADALPATIASAIEARIAALDSDARRVLRAASVIGGASSIEALIALTDLDRPAAMDARAALVFAELLSLVRSESGPLFAFRHAFVRQTAYEMLTPEDRREAHRRTAQWLETTEGCDNLVLADHYERAGDPEHAGHALLHVTHDALVANDLEAAVLHSERGIRAGARGGVRAMLLLYAAEAHAWAARPREALARIDEALEALPPKSTEWFNAVAVRAEACMLAGQTGDLEQWLEVVRSVELGGPGCAPPEVRDRTIVRVAMMLLQSRGSARGRDAVLAIERELEARGEDGTILAAQVLLARAVIESFDGHKERSVGYDLRAARIFEALDVRRWEIIARSNAALDSMMLGSFEDALDALQRAHAAARSIGAAYAIMVTRRHLGYALGLNGRLAEGKAECLIALAEARAIGGPRPMASALVGLAVLDSFAGELASAEAYAREALAEELGPATRATILGLVAHVVLARGRAAEALELAEEAVSLGDAHGFESLEGIARVAHARALHAVGRDADARRSVAQARARLLEQASAIATPRYRQSFLERVSAHAEILALARAWGLE
jgi:tetratricopeptide (TPR) repeat protein